MRAVERIQSTSSEARCGCESGDKVQHLPQRRHGLGEELEVQGEDRGFGEVHSRVVEVI